VHPAIVVLCFEISSHVGRLRVLAEHIVVVPGARSPHRPERGAFDHALLPGALLDQGTENVRDRFVQRPGLPLVGEVGGVLGGAVGEFVADHAQRRRESDEHRAIAVAEHHPLAVPEALS
jgi:hypothetical protein